MATIAALNQWPVFGVRTEYIFINSLILKIANRQNRAFFDLTDVLDKTPDFNSAERSLLLNDLPGLEYT